MITLLLSLVCLTALSLTWCGFFIFAGIDWLILGNNSFGVESGMSGIDCSYVGMLFFCGFVSLLFSLHYFGWVNNWLNFMIVIFLGVMCLLILSEDLLTSLLWWEYLGVVSFFLIIYYGNFDTSYAGNTTIVVSRLGDAGFFLVICFWYSGVMSAWLGCLSTLLVIATKSAILPFCSWLLEAMRAPTPVSCLVHSSTLVAAGVWFVTSYGAILVDGVLTNLLLTGCLTTVLVSGFCAAVFSDIKKIVALSTCNNVSWCIIYCLLGSPLLCAIQLVCHGLSKCLLFIAVGDSLASATGSQNKSCFSIVPYNSVSGFVAILVLSLSVAGMPFLGVFFTKHTFINLLMFTGSALCSLLIILGVFLSYCYSVRLVYLVAFPNGVNSQWLNSTFYFVSATSIVCSGLGYLLCGGLEEVSELGSLYSFFILSVNVLGFILGYHLYSSFCGSGYFSSFGYNDDSVVGYLESFSMGNNFGGLIFNFRLEVGLVQILLGIGKISTIRLTVIPLFLAGVIFWGLV
uniref:NADH dehydrogenase subunit 5 n=1 Tax=Cichlidogyrus halli TaxID=321991 RepID=UPI00315DAD65